MRLKHIVPLTVGATISGIVLATIWSALAYSLGNDVDFSNHYTQSLIIWIGIAWVLTMLARLIFLWERKYHKKGEDKGPRKNYVIAGSLSVLFFLVVFFDEGNPLWHLIARFWKWFINSFLVKLLVGTVVIIWNGLWKRVEDYCDEEI